MTMFDRDVRYGWRGRLGLLLPSGNVAAEPQIQAMLPDGVSLHTTRLRLTGSSDAQLLAMTDNVEPAAELLSDAGVDLIFFHCTAVSTWDAAAEEQLIARMVQATGRPATATSRALVAALRVLSARRLVLVSPYIEAINRREAAFLAVHGFETLNAVGLGIDSPQDMIRVDPGEWYRLVRAHERPDADAYFLSCTAIRSLEVVEALERDLGKPVVTSNQVAAWYALREMSVVAPEAGPGRLFAASGGAT